MQGRSIWKRSKTAMISLDHYILWILYILLIIITIFYFIHFIVPLYPSRILSDSSSGAISIFISLLSLIYALYGINSSTNQLNDAQRRLSNTQEKLSDIQIDYWNTRGIDLYKQKNYRDADLSYEKVLSLGPNDAKIWMNMAVSLYEQSRLDEALNVINKSIKIDQSRADSWNTKGLILHKKAIRASEEQIVFDIDLKEVNVSKYAVPFAQPIILLENQMEQNNETSGVWRNKDEALFEQARIALEKSIEIKTIELATKPTNIAGDWLDNGWLARIWSNVGLVLADQHRYNPAIEACNKAIGLDPKYSGAWHNKGSALASSGRPYEAIGAFNKAIELDPQDAKIWFGKGIAFMTIARKYPNNNIKSVYEESIHAFNKTIELNPLHLNAWYQKGRALFEVGNYSEAINALDKMIDIKPHNQNVWRNKCLCLYKLGKYDEAIKASNVTIALYEKYALCWFDEYNKLYELGKYDEALEAYDKGLDLKSENTLNFVIKGDAICNLAIWHPKRFDDALKAYNKAIESDPLNWLAWCGRCIALNALGIDNQARAAYTRAYRLTALIEHPYKYVEDFEKPIYWP